MTGPCVFLLSQRLSIPIREWLPRTAIVLGAKAPCLLCGEGFRRFCQHEASTCGWKGTEFVGLEGLLMQNLEAFLLRPLPQAFSCAPWLLHLASFGQSWKPTKVTSTQILQRTHHKPLLDLDRHAADRKARMHQMNPAFDYPWLSLCFMLLASFYIYT